MQIRINAKTPRRGGWKAATLVGTSLVGHALGVFQPQPTMRQVVAHWEPRAQLVELCGSGRYVAISPIFSLGLTSSLSLQLADIACATAIPPRRHRVYKPLRSITLQKMSSAAGSLFAPK